MQRDTRFAPVYWKLRAKLRRTRGSFTLGDILDLQGSDTALERSRDLVLNVVAKVPELVLANDTSKKLVRICSLDVNSFW